MYDPTDSLATIQLSARHTIIIKKEKGKWKRLLRVCFGRDDWKPTTTSKQEYQVLKFHGGMVPLFARFISIFIPTRPSIRYLGQEEFSRAVEPSLAISLARHGETVRIFRRLRFHMVMTKSDHPRKVGIESHANHRDAN
jgi:hypothetical protein